MVEEPTPAKKTFGEILQSVDRTILYLILLGCVSASLMITEVRSVSIPATPEKWTKEAYKIIRNPPPPGRQNVVIVDSGFTNATRGESGGQMEATLRTLMRSGTKFAVVSIVEAQCPEIAQRTIDRINLERKKAGEPEYRAWDDYVMIGYFPDGAPMLQTVQQSIRDAWRNRTTKDPDGKDRDVFESPVLKDVQKIEDVKAYVTISASSVMPTIVARIGKQVPVISMVTGVMFPEQLNYYKSGQIKGLVNGLSGCVEFECLMEKGIDRDGNVGGKLEPFQSAPFPGEKNLDRGTSYYLALHVALTLLILAVAIGNIGMFISRRSNRS